MKIIAPILLLIAGLTACAPTDRPAAQTEPESTEMPARIVSLSGTLTEIIHDLGFGDQLVGVDVTSTYPPEINAVPKLGHVSKLNVEALLELRPTLIFVDADNRDKPALNTLADAGIEIVSVPSQPTLDNAAHVATRLEKHLSVNPKTLANYVATIENGSRDLTNSLATRSGPKPRVLFIYARGAKQLMVAGADTEAAAMIALAGGENAITSFTDFKPLTPESLVEAAPDVILMFDSGLESLDGKAGLANVPGISQTPAYKNDRIIAMDGHYLLGFGPRAPNAANDLANYLYPTQTK
ncbi:heme/hemin ABC transporter substrate-binding protein [Neolewinella antarctica]|uniref:Iron complex transport system substrate-binding protein n=1 Tax=Neolewinella antarctica TaxID=442734 RepID=A0ABX0XBX5_9BACT|nr:ABC transporter substrate-binding protein [Neolewinella antarctica]NJC26771.1 iron complex transport system substrate-binding protein [Neolewinella antarctica]